MAVLEVRQLNYVYSGGTPYEKAAIRDVSFSVEKGEFIAVIGHTGSGKSTLVQHLNGLLKPSSGQVLLDGEDIWARPKEIRRVRFRVGMVFQYPEHQLFAQTVREDIAFGPQNMGLSEEEINLRVRKAAAFVELEEALLDASPFDLSGGQQRRAAIAGVMAMEPDILVLDEPTAGLDPRGREQMLARITRYAKDNGVTVILVSHSMEDVAAIADKVLVMNKGALAMFAPTAEVFSRAQELEAMGLSVPSVTRIFMALRARGYDVGDNVYTVEQAAARLLTLCKGGAASC